VGILTQDKPSPRHRIAAVATRHHRNPQLRAPDRLSSGLGGGGPTRRFRNEADCAGCRASKQGPLTADPAVWAVRWIYGSGRLKDGRAKAGACQESVPELPAEPRVMG